MSTLTTATVTDHKIQAAVFVCIYCKALLTSPVKMLLCGHRICQLCLEEQVKSHKTTCPGNETACGETDLLNKDHVAADKCTDADLKKIKSGIQKDKIRHRPLNDRYTSFNMSGTSRSRDGPSQNTARNGNQLTAECQWRPVSVQGYSCNCNSSGISLFLPNAADFPTAHQPVSSHRKQTADQEEFGGKNFSDEDEARNCKESQGHWEPNKCEEATASRTHFWHEENVCEQEHPVPQLTNCISRYVGQLEGENSMLRWHNETMTARCLDMERNMQELNRKLDCLLQQTSSSDQKCE